MGALSLKRGVYFRGIRRRFVFHFDLSFIARIAKNEPETNILTTSAKSRRQLCDSYNVTEEFVDHLIQLKFLKPSMSGGDETFDADDELRLEVVLKGRAHGFSFQEIALLIRKEAPRLDGVLI